MELKNFSEWHNTIVFFVNIDDRYDLNHFYYYYNPFIEGIFKEGLRCGKSIQMLKIEDLGRFLNRNFKYEGVIASIDRKNERNTVLWEKLHKKIPCINLNSCSGISGENYIKYNDSLGITSICNHLYKEGFRKYGFIAIKKQGWVIDRFHAFNNYCQNNSDVYTKPEWNNFNFDKDIKKESLTYDEFITSVADILHQTDRPEVLVCANDDIASGVMRVAESMGLQVPKDIAITGYNYMLSQISKAFIKKLTSVHMNNRYISRLAVNVLNEIISGKRSAMEQQILLEPDLIINTTSLKKSYKQTDNDVKWLKNTIYHFILTNIDKTNTEISKELISNLNFTSSHFSRKFKSLFDTTFVTFVNSIKVKHAAQELRLTDKPVISILTDYSFGSFQHFYKQFYKKHNMSPLEYRENKGEQRKE
jgi:DNA-binding LacI/PurR family transcriptional regulator